jgi:hypothetical protein
LTVEGPDRIVRALNDLTTDVARIRSVLWRELETINSYEELARQASSEEVRAFFNHLAQEEKEHVAEATMLLRRLDPGQESHFQKEYAAAHFTGAAPAAAKPNPVEDLRLPRDPSRTPYAIPAPPSPIASGLTVGSLRRRAP